MLRSLLLPRAPACGPAIPFVRARRVRTAIYAGVALLLALAPHSPAEAGRKFFGNSPPTISGSPPTTVVAGARYAFRPTASDPEGDRLKFTVANKPVWATFDPATGTLAGTPTADQLGIYRDVRIGVTDGRNKVALAPFTVTVQPGTPQPVANRAPTIGGVPATSVTAGQTYAFPPTAADPDGNALAFAIANRPVWATFDPKTGALAGTPASTGVGTYANVTISVSDGSLSATLAPFTITVAAAAPPPPTTGSAELSWTPPTTRADGSALTNLAGYRVYYGTTRGSYTKRLDLPSPGVTSMLVEGLVAGTYYFVTTAYDANGVESGYSAEASKTIY